MDPKQASNSKSCPPGQPTFFNSNAYIQFNTPIYQSNGYMVPTYNMQIIEALPVESKVAQKLDFDTPGSTVPYVTKPPLQTKKSQNKNSKTKTLNKFCNCSKTLCLKLYCDCFARGEYCNEKCSCINCRNIFDFESDRQKAIKGCLERNKDAFKGFGLW